MFLDHSKLLFDFLLLFGVLLALQCKELQKLLFLEVLVLWNLTIFVLALNSDVKGILGEVHRFCILVGSVFNIWLGSVSQALGSMAVLLQMEGFVELDGNLF